LDGYLFRIDAARDDKPYFFHFLRWRTLSILHEQIGRRSRAFAEIGYLMLIAALVQAAAMAAAMIILPLAPGVRAIRGEPRKAATFGYFLMIGIGFMLLEMAFLQKLILYLGHPIYSAAAVITGFLVFAGLGSQASQYWPIRSRRLGLAAGSAVAVLGLAYLVTMEHWLTPAWGLTMAGRFAIAVATIAPLAFAMGHMLPTGMRLVSRAAPALVPWAWAINGLASVVATVAAPLLAMQVGFALVMLLAVGCYLAAGALSLALPQTR
jgi:hypothetical protein